MHVAIKLALLLTTSWQSTRASKVKQMKSLALLITSTSHVLTSTQAHHHKVVQPFLNSGLKKSCLFADQFGYARALAKIYPMRGKTENLVSSGAFTGAVVAEGSGLTVTDSTNFFTGTAMTAKKIVAGAIISEEQLQDATPAFLDYVINGLGRALAETEDKQFFNGDGSGANFTGLLNAANTTIVRQGGSDSSGKDTFGEISWTDLWNLRLGINSGVGANGVFVVPQSVFGFLMKETGGSRPIFDQVRPIEITSIGMTALEGNSYFTPTGRPMHVVPDSLFPSSAANKASAVYCDFAQFTVMGVREDVTVNEYKEYFGATGLGGTHQRVLKLLSVLLLPSLHHQRSAFSKLQLPNKVI